MITRNTTTLAALPPQPSADAARRRKRSLRDERGLSSVEYIVLFVIILIGSLTVWHKLGKGMAAQLGDGTDAVRTTLGSHMPGGDPTSGNANSGSAEPPAPNPKEPASGTHQPCPTPSNQEGGSRKRALTF